MIPQHANNVIQITIYLVGTAMKEIIVLVMENMDQEIQMALEFANVLIL